MPFAHASQPPVPPTAIPTEPVAPYAMPPYATPGGPAVPAMGAYPYPTPAALGATVVPAPKKSSSANGASLASPFSSILRSPA